MVDSIYRTRSLGVAAEGLPDQYADGKAAQVWEYYIGCKQSRTAQYKNWLVQFLNTHKCKNILDVACGTGVDSILLLEEGFNVVSTDASDKMLKHALKERWTRRKESKFDDWVIEEANWLTLADDLSELELCPTDGFDAVICLGNSFAHLPDFEGDQSKQKEAISNFKKMIKPGGILLIDHRNYDEILLTGKVPQKNIYYNSMQVVDIKCSNLYVNGQPQMITLDYVMDMSNVMKKSDNGSNGQHRFRLSYYPHRLDAFSSLLADVFGEGAKHSIYGDFKPVGEIKAPAYYIHSVKKPA